MTEQERDNAAQQQARAEENKQETEQLIKRHRQEILSPSNMLGILTVYLLFVAAVAAFGVIAFYSGHLATLKFVFYICIPLLIFPLLGGVWYLRILLSRQSAGKVVPGKQSRLSRFLQSPTVIFLARFGNNRIFKLFNLALCLYMIADAIRLFPLHPRFSLAIIVSFLGLFLVFVTFLVANQIVDNMEKSADITSKMFDIVAYTYGIAETSRKYIEATEPPHQEAHQTILDAVKAIDHTTRVMADVIHRPTPPQAAATPQTEDDEEPSDG